MAYKTEIVEAEGKYFLRIPEQVVESMGLNEECGLKVEEKSSRSFLVSINRKDTSNVRCPICLDTRAEYECQICGELICASCYWATGKVCKECMGKN